MSNYSNAKVLVSQFSGQHNTIGVPRPFCKFMGSLEGGAFLSQLIFWSDKGKREDGWFYKRHSEWEEELMLSPHKVNKFSSHLKSLGILKTKLKKANNAPTIYYQFDYERFVELFVAFLKSDSENFNNPILKNLIMDSENFNNPGLSNFSESITEEHQRLNSKQQQQESSAAVVEFPSFFEELLRGIGFTGNLARKKLYSAFQEREEDMTRWVLALNSETYRQSGKGIKSPARFLHYVIEQQLDAPHIIGDEHCPYCQAGVVTIRNDSGDMSLFYECPVCKRTAVEEEF